MGGLKRKLLTRYDDYNNKNGRKSAKGIEKKPSNGGSGGGDAHGP